MKFNINLNQALKKEPVLFIFSLLLLIFVILYPRQILKFTNFVDWRTIITLTGLLIITTSLKESRFFNKISERLLVKFRTERELAIFLILFSVLLSTFLTNDITLFIVIPLTIKVQNFIENNISKLIILEAISVNVGSSLTPIGNPQNIFLWHKWDISFFTFLIKLSPLFFISLSILLLFTFFLFPNKKIRFRKLKVDDNLMDWKLFIISSFLLVIFLILLELKIAVYILPFIIILYLFYNIDILKKVDWLLVILFIIIFIDFHILSINQYITNLFNKINYSSHLKIFLISVLTSQAISNVPASIFLSKFSHDWYAIAYGVNVGGNGLILSSFANIIAVRLSKKKGLWLKFHKYSLPYFVILTIIIAIFMKLYLF